MQETITQTKQCYKCKLIQTKDSFNKDKRSKDGLQQKCKSCEKQYRILNKDRLLAYGNNYYLENKEAILISQKTYYQKNKDLIAEKTKIYASRQEVIDRKRKYQKEYMEINKDKILESKRRLYHKHRAKEAERKKRYHQTEKGKMARKNSKHKRRAIEKNGSVTSNQILQLQKNYKTCYWCGESLSGKKVHIDHYVPLSKGGLHTISNLVISCEKCNLSKSAKDPIAFANSIGKLL